MASRHVALLRGINVGKAKRVAMADLRALVENLGYGDITTLLNSGNVIFSASRGAPDKIAARLEAAIAAELGVSSRVTVLTASEIAAIISENPLGKVAKDPSRLLVSILRNAADRTKLEPLFKMKWAPEVLAPGPRAAYLWCPAGIIDSRAAAALARALGDGVTSRNWATLTKLEALTREK